MQMIKPLTASPNLVGDAELFEVDFWFFSFSSLLLNYHFLCAYIYFPQTYIGKMVWSCSKNNNSGRSRAGAQGGPRTPPPTPHHHFGCKKERYKRDGQKRSYDSVALSSWLYLNPCYEYSSEEINHSISCNKSFRFSHRSPCVRLCREGSGEGRKGIGYHCCGMLVPFFQAEISVKTMFS